MLTDKIVFSKIQQAEKSLQNILDKYKTVASWHADWGASALNFWLSENC